MTTEVTTNFSDFNPGMTYDMGDMNDETFGVSDDSAMSLSQFLARPIRLYDINWAVGDETFFVARPWRDFLTQLRVVNRVSNYKNLRGKLHLKFTVNGNPFYYGLLLASYLPLPTNDSFGPGFSSADPNLVLASQNPHIYIDPTNNVAGTLVCPFFWPFNALDLTENNAENMGELTVRRMVQLFHANGSSAPLNVTVFAWMSDVTLSAPTATNAFGMVAQSGDEYGDEPNSKQPMVLTRTMKLTTTIMKYARASQMVAMGMEAAMKVLGFCRPTLLANVTPMRPTFLGNLANVNLTDASQKLTFDCKQEVVIDPRVVGMKPDDEMNITELAKRESYICSFSWAPSDTSGTPLHYHVVTPVQYTSSGLLPNVAYALSPSAWISVPFSFWRGSTMFRIKIVASSFHKGRLRISYDPNHALALDQMNVTQNHIVDIAECKDFCIKIGWNQPSSYVQVASLGALPFGNVPFTGSNIADNGSIKIEVLNELSTPSADDFPVTVVVFTSMCDDFEVQGPEAARLSPLTFFPEPGIGRAIEPLEMIAESGVEGVAEKLDDFNAPCMEQQGEECQLAPSLYEDHTSDIYFGEKIKSWRTCMKRYSYHNTTIINPNLGVSNYTRPLIPNYRGYCPTAVNRTVTNTPINYSDMTLQNWVIPAYGAMRGSVRHKYTIMGSKSNGIVAGGLQVTRSGGKPGWTEQFFSYTTTPGAGGVDTASEAGWFYRRFWSHTWPGSSQTAMQANPTVEVDLPYYDNRRFWHARRTDYDVANTEVYGIRIDCLCAPNNTSYLQNFWAVGDDFSLHFFLNTPIVYVRDVDPDPSITV